MSDAEEPQFPNRDLIHTVQDYLNKHRDDLTDAQLEDFYNRFRSLRDEVEEVADCDHEDVEAHIPPKFLEREGAVFLSPSMPTGTVSPFHGKCQDCGAEVETALEITAATGGEGE